MITPLVAQLIAEERIAAGSRAAENVRLAREVGTERPSAWSALTHRVGVTATRLRGALHHQRAAVPCPCP